MPPLFCVACGWRCDPDWSFCPRCGSAVFVNANDRDAFRAAAATAAGQLKSTVRFPQPAILPRPNASTPASPRSATSDAAPSTILRTVRRAPTRIAGNAPAVSMPGAGCIWSSIKLSIAVFGVWWLTTTMLSIPEVRAVKDALEQGRNPNVDAAIDAVRVRLGLIDRVRGERRPDASGAVYSTGPDVTAPRVVSQVKPSYTRDAMRARIEGEVLLQGTVRPDGTVSDISVIRSLDQRFGLDREAIKAFEAWRFQPGERHGEPVSVRVTASMRFTLP